MDKGSHLDEKFADMKSQRVDESFVPTLEDEAAEVANLLAEPKSDHVSVDGVLHFGQEKSGKCLEMEGFSCGFEYGFTASYGGLDSYNAQGEDDLKLEVLDGLLDDVDEVDDIHAAHDLSSACEDFLLDIEFAEKISELGCGPIEGLNLRNSSSESHSPGLSGSSIVATGISESSTVTIPESECKNDSLVKIVTCGLHSTFKSKCGCQVPVEDECPTSCNVDKVNEMDDDDNVLLSSILSKCKKRAKSSVLGNKVKRLRKPTRRYIEEFSDLKSAQILEGQKGSTASLKDKHLKVKSHNELSTESSGQPPSGSWLHGRHLKKHVSIAEFESDDDLYASESDDDRLKKKKPRVDVDRRKHQRMWTLSEVMKLIDGIAQYGVGKWTDIKRLLFSSSAHRTPIDLRDKWRNLLRASSAQKKNKREVEEKHALRTLPKPVLCRIRELATIHPYPRVRSSKITGNTNVAPSKLPAKNKGAPFSSHGKNVRRKRHNT